MTITDIRAADNVGEIRSRMDAAKEIYVLARPVWVRTSPTHARGAVNAAWRDGHLVAIHPESTRGRLFLVFGQAGL